MNPKYLPTTVEGKLVHLVEECSEVTKAITKSIRFGLDNTVPPSSENNVDWFPPTNRATLLEEMKDLEMALIIVREAIQLTPQPKPTPQPTTIRRSRWALLWSEWSVTSKSASDGTQVPRTHQDSRECPSCGYNPPHDKGCLLDAALTDAGYVTAESRDAARQKLLTR